MSEDTEYRKTGIDFAMMEPRDQLKTLLREHMHDKQFSELAPVTFDHRGAALIGHIAMEEPTLRITDPVTGEAHETTFVEIFHESELH